MLNKPNSKVTNARKKSLHFKINEFISKKWYYFVRNGENVLYGLRSVHNSLFFSFEHNDSLYIYIEVAMKIDILEGVLREFQSAMNDFCIESKEDLKEELA
jgi:hypothetical protein